ncbi:MAG: molybdopterin-dependent oxidoreductase [Gemmatimonadota bacterium]|nr:MAG: molybdopterin-dependent oxidoreductase [Gemmatimonadota bacterium]
MEAGEANVLTVCPFCACGCGLYLQQVDAVLTGVTPSEHHPVSRGRLCTRGWAAHEASLWGHRLTRPLVRHGGIHEPTDWHTALRHAANLLTDILASGSSIGVLGSGRATNEENFLAVRLARGALRTGHVDSCTRASYQALLAGVSESASACNLDSALKDTAHCEVILLLEGDIADTHPQAAHAIMKAVQRGARLVTMGPVKTRMSRLAWLHLPFVPGGESAVAAKFASVAERATSDNRAADGMAANLPVGSLPASTHLISSAQLQRAVEAYTRASRAAIVLAPTSAAAPWLRAIATAFARLAAGTRQLQRPGSVLLPLPCRSNTRGALEMGAAPHCLPGCRALTDDAARSRLLRVWGSELAAERGLDIEAMLSEVRGLIVLADDPPLALTSEEAGRRALSKLECLIVLDAFATPTAELSHVALPIGSSAETDGTVTSMEGRIQEVRACTPPPGEARPGWWVLNELAAALGMSKTHESAQDVFHDILVAVPEYASAVSSEESTPHGCLGVLPGILGDPQAKVAESAGARDSSREALAALRTAVDGTVGFPFLLVQVGSFEWEDDALVAFSPTLSRDHRSRSRLWPDGYVQMNTGDADRLGIRDGWRARITSDRGEVVIPVRLCEDVEPAMMLVPFAFRDQLEPVLKCEVMAAVNVERI